MPSVLPSEEDDPVIASYDVFITNPLSKGDNASSQADPSSRLFVLQYPSHRPVSKPYNEARSQKPTRLRLKPSTGMIEVDVPILTKENFNEHAGGKYGQALAESRVSQTGGSQGLAGGFVSGPISTQNINLHDVPMHGEQNTHVLDTQTLGGKIIPACERDPIYMLGSFRDNELHLTHLDAVVQMRPQLHHIDAEEEINHQKFHPSTGQSGKAKAGLEGPAKLESKAIELKLKDNKEDPKDRNLNSNARLLREIQADQWRSHNWVDEDEEESWNKADTFVTLKMVSGSSQGLRVLKSMVSNDDWLDKMSVPREDGKKGLRAKLKGRDRERARRKKVEHQKRQMTTEGTNVAARPDLSSDSDLSSLSEHSDVEVVEQSAGLREVDIKQEPGSLAAAPSTVNPAPGPVPVTSPTRKRGRPKKS